MSATPAIHEASGWLRTTLAGRTEELQELGRAGTVIAFLTAKSNLTCDRCGEGAAYCQIFEPNPRLKIIASICDTCHDLEMGQR